MQGLRLAGLDLKEAFTRPLGIAQLATVVMASRRCEQCRNVAGGGPLRQERLLRVFSGRARRNERTRQREGDLLFDAR